MRFPRQRASVLLACVLVIGGLLAPLSHLVYMAVGDMYTPLHGAMSTHKTVHSQCYESAHDRHAACPYLMLFAVPLTGDLAQPFAPPAYKPVAETLPSLSLAPQQTTFSKFHLARGPPCNS